jgi:hypothetical protein
LDRALCYAQAEGGAVATVSKLTGIGAGKGEMYTIFIVPDEGAGEQHVQQPSSSVHLICRQSVNLSP